MSKMVQIYSKKYLPIHLEIYKEDGGGITEYHYEDKI